MHSTSRFFELFDSSDWRTLRSMIEVVVLSPLIIFCIYVLIHCHNSTDSYNIDRYVYFGQIKLKIKGYPLYWYSLPVRRQMNLLWAFTNAMIALLSLNFSCHNANTHRMLYDAVFECLILCAFGSLTIIIYSINLYY